MAVHHMGLTCRNPGAVAALYTRYFGFRRARVVGSGDGQVVFLKSDAFHLELFRASADSPAPAPGGAGPDYPGWRHLAFSVDDVNATLAALGPDAHITAGPMGFDDVVPGWRTAWVSDPDGNIVEVSRGYVDQDDVPIA